MDIITNIEQLYSKCENMEELYNKYYSPLMNEYLISTRQFMQELKKKQDIIDKAIVYAESSSFEVNTKDYGMLEVCNAIDVLDILKEVE